MKTFKLRLLAPLALTAVFGISSLVYAGPTKAGKGEHKGQRGDRMQKLAEKLNLTDDQKAKIAPILKSAMESRKAIKEDGNLSDEQKREKMKALGADTKAKLSAILTPEQKKKMAELRKEHKGKDGKDGKGKRDKKKVGA